MKSNNYARKRRQLKFRAKQLRKLLAANAGVLTKKAERLLAKMKKMLGHKKPIISSRDLQKALGAAAVLFGLGMTNPVDAQNFAPPVSSPFGLDSISYYAFPALADLDADGDLDLFIGQYGEPGLYSNYETNFLLFENTGTLGTPAFGTPLANPFGTMITYENYYSLPTFADLDGDGDQDMIGGANYGEFYFYENIGTATAPAYDDPQVNPFGLDSVSQYSFPDLVDLDGDGDFDLLSGGVLYNTLTGNRYGDFVFFQNIGTPTAPAFATPVTNPFGLSSTYNFNIPTTGDVDGDGDIDILSSEYYGNLVYFENTGSATGPQFASPVQNPFGLVVDSIAEVIIPELADLDNDGDMDLFTFEDYGVPHFYENTVNNPVSVKELIPAFELDVFPNPVQDKLVIQTSEAVAQIEVIDLLGRRLEVLHPKKNTITLTHLHAGVYFLRVMGDNGDFVVKKIQKI